MTDLRRLAENHIKQHRLLAMDPQAILALLDKVDEWRERAVRWHHAAIEDTRRASDAERRVAALEKAGRAVLDSMRTMDADNALVDTHTLVTLIELIADKSALLAAAPSESRTGYLWDCPNCGERIETFTLPPRLGPAALPAEDHEHDWERGAHMTEAFGVDGRVLACAICGVLNSEVAAALLAEGSPANLNIYRYRDWDAVDVHTGGAFRDDPPVRRGER